MLQCIMLINTSVNTNIVNTNIERQLCKKQQTFLKFYSAQSSKQEQSRSNTTPNQENTMLNYFNPQSMITQMDTKAKEYTESVLDTIEAFQIANIKSFDQLTNSMFTTYTSKAIDTVKEVNVNAKEIVKTGKLKSFTYVGNQG